MREIIELGARDAIMTSAHGLQWPARDGAERVLLRARIDPGRRGALVGRLRRRVPRGLRGGALRPPLAEQCLRFAVGCGAESIQHFGAGVLDPREVERLLPEVRGRSGSEPALPPLVPATGRRRYAAPARAPVPGNCGKPAWIAAGNPCYAHSPSVAEPKVCAMEVEIGRGKKGRRAVRLR